MITNNPRGGQESEANQGGLAGGKVLKHRPGMAVEQTFQLEIRAA